MRRLLMLIPVVLLLPLAGMVLFPGGKRERAAPTSPSSTAATSSPSTPTRCPGPRTSASATPSGKASTRIDPETLEPGPRRRRASVDVSDDKTVYTFHLRPEAKWSNGDPSTAHDFVFAWRRMLEEPGEYTYLFYYIKGAEDVLTTRSPRTRKSAGLQDGRHRGARRQDAARDAQEPGRRTSSTSSPSRRSSRCTSSRCEQFRRSTRRPAGVSYDQEFTRPPHLVTNGPYRLHDWEFKRRLRFVKPASTTGTAPTSGADIDRPGRAARTRWRSSSCTTAARWTGSPTSRSRRRSPPTCKRKGSTTSRLPGFGTYFYSFNCLPEAPRRPAEPVRRHARPAGAGDGDRQAADRRERHPHGRAGRRRTTSPPACSRATASPPGLPLRPRTGARSCSPRPATPAAGVARASRCCSTPAPTTATSPRSSAPVARRPRRRRRRSRASRSRSSASACTTRTTPSPAPAGSATTPTRPPSPTSTSPTASNNDSDWSSNASTTASAPRPAAEPDDAEAAATCSREAETILLDEAPIIPLYHYVNVDLLRDNVNGINANPRNMVIFKDVSWKREPVLQVNPASSHAGARADAVA